MRVRLAISFIALLLICSLAAPVMGQESGQSDSVAPEEEPRPVGYLVFPFPYALPGIGEGVALTGLLGNLLNTGANAYLVGLAGDAEGFLASVWDVSISPDVLTASVEATRLSQMAVEFYHVRGMDSGAEDFSFAELSSYRDWAMELEWEPFDLPLGLFMQTGWYQYDVARLRDPEGELIVALDPAFVLEVDWGTIGLRGRFTDDSENPRSGVKFNLHRDEFRHREKSHSDFAVWDMAMVGYVPVGSLSTIAFSFSQASAWVTRSGNTEPAVVRQDLGLQCAPGDTVCEEVAEKIVANFVAERRFGNGHPLGGTGRLWSYPAERFRGAHSMFVGAEFQWNLSRENTPFDYFIWRDVRTSHQWVFFVEAGSVTDQREELGETVGMSYGTGYRIIASSGLLYRAEVGMGDEGVGLILFFGYPW